MLIQDSDVFLPDFNPIHTVGTKIMVLPYPNETTTAGGIIIPDTAQERPTKGVVVVVGNKCQTAEIGDDAHFGTYAGIAHEIPFSHNAVKKTQTVYMLHEEECAFFEKKTQTNEEEA